MKTTYLLFMLVFGATGVYAEQVYKLTDAVQRKLVTVNAAGASYDTTFKGEYSSHYGPCIALEVSSASAEALNLSLEYGYKLVPADSSMQTMVVTQTLLVKLQPKQKKNYRVYAMCSEAHDGGPSAGAPFKLSNRFGGNVLKLTELLNRKKYQGDAAQNAVWCFTDNYSIGSIHSADTVMMYELRRFVAKAKGLDVAKIYASDDGPAPEPVRRSRSVYSGSLSYSYSRTAKITVALYDEDNKLVKMYVNNETQTGGEHTYNYQISSDEMDDKRHYLRMYRDGRLEQEISIIPR